MLYPRNLKSLILEATEDSPVVLLNGARQTGKSTLMQQLYRPNGQPDYLTLDDVAVLAAATLSPQDFLDGLSKRVLIDEIQRAPELFLALKRAVDQNRIPGRFLLKGCGIYRRIPKNVFGVVLCFIAAIKTSLLALIFGRCRFRRCGNGKAEP